MITPDKLPRKPDARTERVEDLVERVLRGFVRVPTFQRGLKWKSANVVELFDSVYRGFPIGTLLFSKLPAAAQRVAVGPLIVNAPETSEAWWVVDGQQRLTALTACLARETPFPSRPNAADPYILYFDPEQQSFEPPPRGGTVPARWVPLPYLLDATRLIEWVFQWGDREDERLRRTIFESGKRIREYAIPLYLIDTPNEDVPKEIFYRINQAGAPLEWKDVHKALFGSSGTTPSTLEDLADELADVGMGRLDEKRLLTCLFAIRGKDPTQSLDDHYRKDVSVLKGAVQEALPILRQVLSFLRKDAGVPHLRLLPKSILLDVLSRYFALHPEPSPRVRMLLTRWFWRTVLGAGAVNDRTLRRRGINAVGPNGEISVQRLLSLLHKDARPRDFELPAAFDARADDTRLALLALAHLEPKDIESGAPLDVAGLLEQEDKAAFVKIFEGRSIGLVSSPANRLIYPPGRPIRSVLSKRIKTPSRSPDVLVSHAIDAQAAALLAQEDAEGFLRARSEALTRHVRRFADRMAAWSASDRPSIDHVLQEAGVEL